MQEIILDDWQKEFLKTDGDKMLCTGRQVGKSKICSIDAGEFAIKHSNKTILMIAPTERQSFELFDKTLDYLATKYENFIKRKKDKPTKHRIMLRNGSKILCYPTGVSGLGIRGLTVHRLYVDEASRVPDEVWNAVTPMLLTTAGQMILISTPFGRKGYFFEMWNNEESSFKKFSATSEVVIRNRPISKTWTELQRDKALEFIEREKSRMSKLEFAQEYMGEFLEDLQQLFPDNLIKACMIAKRPDVISQKDNLYLGVDIARMGEDESTFEIFRKVNPKLLVQIENQVTTKTYLTETSSHIKQLDKRYNFNKILIDDEGIGIGVFDDLLNDPQTRRKVIGINNSKRVLDKNGERTKKLLKQDLYFHLRYLMENDQIQLLDDPEIFQSLKSVQFEATTSTKGEPIYKIFGTYTHIAEGIIRGAWCLKYKDLNIVISSIKI